MLKIKVFILIFITLGLTQIMLNPDRTGYWGAAPPAGGPNVWYYGVGSDDYTNTQAYPYNGNYYIGDAVTLTAAGTITKISIKADCNNASAENIKIGLYTLVTVTWTLYECLTVSCAGTTPTWYDGTLAVPKTNTAGEVVRVMWVRSGTEEAAWDAMYKGASGGFYVSRSYASACGTWSSADDQEYAVRVYVD